jgi:hypothetical protein
MDLGISCDTLRSSVGATDQSVNHLNGSPNKVSHSRSLRFRMLRIPKLNKSLRVRKQNSEQ